MHARRRQVDGGLNASACMWCSLSSRLYHTYSSAHLLTPPGSRAHSSQRSSDSARLRRRFSKERLRTNFETEPDRGVVVPLFVGVFAYIIGNWNALARIVFESFAGLGLIASGGSLSAGELLQPGRIAEIGLDAGRPILASISDLMGFVSFFENFLQIIILLFAWLVVLLSFFILAIQLFVTLIEFKLATLAGFILVPFGLFNKTAFMAERVLGLVISSGVKVLVLAVIVGIGSTIFGEFTAGFAGEPTIEDAMAIVLAALSMLALGIFGPGIANGIVSGGPQLGAGAAVGAGLAAGGGEGSSMHDRLSTIEPPAPYIQSPDSSMLLWHHAGAPSGSLTTSSIRRLSL